MPDLSDQACALLESQTQSWDLLRDHRAAVAAAEIHDFDFGRFIVKAQFNRGRLKMCSATIDPQTIRNRQCFLCDANRPPEQQSLVWKHGFKVLCNPFPILPEHFTIVQTEHTPQRILPSIPIMLDLARDMDRFTIFYNGPQCGASAPDHMHFQAGTKGYMPVDDDFPNVSKQIADTGDVRTFISDDYLRRFIAFESTGPHAIPSAFSRFHDRMRAIQANADEPMMNVMCRFDSGVYRLLVFVRVKHRPSFYFATDHTRMLISPGAIDMGGVVVVPREEDFKRIDRAHLIQMYEEVSLPAEQLAKIAQDALV